MIRPSDVRRAAELEARLRTFPTRLPGVRSQAASATLVAQIVESIRRIEYLRHIAANPVSTMVADPTSDAFDPLRAAVLRHRAGEIDEAFWLVFLATHFGRHRRTKWRLARDIYGQLAQGQTLTWHRITGQMPQFEDWLVANQDELRNGPNRHHFGNHRKYESLSAESRRGTGRVFESYVRWVGANRGHALRFAELTQGTANPFEAFDRLYHSMGDVLSFGRTARFDYLTLVGNLGLAPIAPGLPYLDGATGPLSGARLLFKGDTDDPSGHRELSAAVVQLGAHLGVGMQVLEDSLCNWQKNPTRFVPFRG